jgi:hypothetical protein
MHYAQQSIKLIAGKSLFTKVLTGFIFGFYLLNSVLNHATNLIQDRCTTFKKNQIC